MTTAILSALPEEQSGLVESLEQARRVMHAGRSFWTGALHGKPVVLALSGIGKVAAATTATAAMAKPRMRRRNFAVSAVTGEGIDRWALWLRERLAAPRPAAAAQGHHHHHHG